MVKFYLDSRMLRYSRAEAAVVSFSRKAIPWDAESGSLMRVATRPSCVKRMTSEIKVGFRALRVINLHEVIANSFTLPGVPLWVVFPCQNLLANPLTCPGTDVSKSKPGSQQSDPYPNTHFVAVSPDDMLSFCDGI